MRVINMFAALGLSAAMIGCATSVPLEGSSMTPAARGNVKVTKGDSGNSRVSLEVEHLAPAENLVPPRHHYVVWADSGSGGRVVLLGLLKPEENLEAKLEGPVPFNKFRIVVTAEDQLSPNYPSSTRVFETRYVGH